VLVVTWNVKAICGVSLGRLDTLLERLASVQPDILLLQEVGDGAVHLFLEGLQKHGLRVFWGGCVAREGKPYGNIIASPWPLQGVASDWSGAPWPQLLTRATVAVEQRDVDVLTAHIPNGSGNGWRKVDTLQALTRALRGSAAGPRILGGDFNEPRRFLPDGDLVSFGARRRSDGTFSLEGNRRDSAGRQPAETRPRLEWDRAVKDVLAPGASHGLRHAYHEVHGFSAAPATHEVQGKPRFFDHLLVSQDFAVEDAGFFHEWRAEKLSDHSAAWTKLRFRGANSAA
jgi:endonuclease/exonuclease/phosphatase family metal-dependent hydrolase